MGALTADRGFAPATHFVASSTGARCQFLSYADAAADWLGLIARNSASATLFHTEPWLQLLRQAYDYEIVIASMRDGLDLGAACLLARSKNPLNGTWVSLPFS